MGVNKLQIECQMRSVMQSKGSNDDLSQSESPPGDDPETERQPCGAEAGIREHHAAVRPPIPAQRPHHHLQAHSKGSRTRAFAWNASERRCKDQQSCRGSNRNMPTPPEGLMIQFLADKRACRYLLTSIERHFKLFESCDLYLFIHS